MTTIGEEGSELIDRVIIDIVTPLACTFDAVRWLGVRTPGSRRQPACNVPGRADGDPNPGTNESLNAAARAGSSGGQLYGNKKAGSPDSRLSHLRTIYRVLRDMHWKTINSAAEIISSGVSPPRRPVAVGHGAKKKMLFRHELTHSHA